MKILLGITGSVAAKLAPKLATRLSEGGGGVKALATEKALFFCGPLSWPHTIPLLRNKDEWGGMEYAEGAPILHIELRKWADIFLIAPLSANTLAKLAIGLADNLLTSVARAWDPQKPLILAPAMNTLMWKHPATNEHLERLKGWYPRLRLVMPVEKELACGDIGVGAMAHIDEIVRIVSECEKKQEGVKDVHAHSGL